MKPVDETSLAQMVYDDWRAGRERMHSLIELCKEADRQWDGVMTPKDFPWKNCSNLNVPITSSIGDTLLAYLVRNLLGQRPLLKVKARGETPQRNAKIMEAVIDDQAYNDTNLFNSMVEAFHDGLRYGVWAVIVDWDEYEIDVPVRIAVSQTNGDGEVIGFEEQTVTKKKIISRPKVTPQNITEIVVSPQATCINNDGVGNPADYVIFRRFFKMDDLVKKSTDNGGVYFNIDKLSTQKHSLSFDELLKEKEERLGINRNNITEHDFEGLEGWYWHDINGDGKNELCIFTVIIDNGKPVLIRNQECPFRHYKIPLIWQKLFPERGLYSKSVPAWLKDIQDEINTIHNQRRDAVSLSLLKMWKYRLGSRFDANQEIYPGCMIGVMDMEDFSPAVTYEQGIVPAINEEQLLNTYIEKMTGITDYALGRESSSISSPTATGTLALINNSNLRIDLITKFWRNGGLRELGDFLGELNKQFYPIESKLEPINPSLFLETDLDQGMLRILISDLEGDFKYEYAGNHNLIDKNAERMQSVFLYDLLMSNPLIRDNPDSVYDLTKYMLSTYGQNEITLTSPQESKDENFEQLKQAVLEAGYLNRLEQIDNEKENLVETEKTIASKEKHASTKKSKKKNRHA